MKAETKGLLLAILVGCSLAIGVGCRATPATVTFAMNDPNDDPLKYTVRLVPPRFLSKGAQEGLRDIYIEEWESAIKNMKIALAEGESVYFCNVCLGVCYEKLEQYDLAAKHYKLAMRERPVGDARKGWGRVKNLTGDGEVTAVDEEAHELTSDDF